MLPETRCARVIDIRPVLPLVKAPTLVTRRSGEILPPEPCKYIAEHVPGARYVETPGVDGERGEVLVASTVRDLVFGAGLTFGDRGAHELKGVPGEWRVPAVAGSGS